jgi:hypothetical protein
MKKLVVVGLMLLASNSYAKCILTTHIADGQSFQEKVEKDVIVNYSYELSNESSQIIYKRIVKSIKTSDHESSGNKDVDVILKINPGESTGVVSSQESIKVWPRGNYLNVHSSIESTGCQMNQHIIKFNVR